MTSPSDCLAIIPAKGTSRRIPRKNLAMCAGKTLLRRAVDCAINSRIFEAIVVSSELLEARNEVHSAAYFHLRNAKLSAEGIGVAAVVFDVLSCRRFSYDSFCILWPTSPLRTPEMLRRAWDLFKSSQNPCLHSVSNGVHDGSFIFYRMSEFLKHLSLDYPVHMGIDIEIDPEYVCDVNTPDDLAEAERRLLARGAMV